MSRFSNALISGILHLDELTSILYGDLKQNIFKRDPSKGNLFGDSSTKTTIESSEATITTPKLNLSSDKIVLKNTNYGTANPPTSGAVEGQIYFKIIS